MGTVLIRPPGHRRDVALRPAATAMVWIGEGQRHEMIAVPGVSLADDDVLVAVEMSTICADDLTAVHSRHGAAPRVPGHESVGRVIALGDHGALTVDGTALRIGDRVVWSTTIACGRCPHCADGFTQNCVDGSRYGEERIGAHGELSGTFGTHVQLRRGTAIVRVPETLPAAVLAPASCAAATAAAALRRVGHDLDGHSVRVHGASLTGLAAAAIAAEQGAVVEIVESDPARQEWARRFGSTELDAAPDIVIVTTADAVSAAIRGVAVAGTVVLVGRQLPGEPATIDAADLAARLVTIVGVHDASARDLTDAVAFLSGRGRAYPFADVVGDVRPLGDLDAALAAASVARTPLRVGVIPG